jgi:hypothetical protein
VSRRIRTDLPPADAWECPCGPAPPSRWSTLTGVKTVVSIREAVCPFCGRRYDDEHRIPRTKEIRG